MHVSKSVPLERVCSLSDGTSHANPIAVPKRCCCCCAKQNATEALTKCAVVTSGAQSMITFKMALVACGERASGHL